jgi:hypothetical protein
MRIPAQRLQAAARLCWWPIWVHAFAGCMRARRGGDMVMAKLAGRVALTFAVATMLLAGCQGANNRQPASAGPTSVGPTENGVSGLSANEVLDRSKTALKQAKSYRLKGDHSADGVPLNADFRISGSDLAGRLTMKGANLELLSIAGQRYMRPDEKFMAISVGADKAKAMAKLLADRWILVAADDKDMSEMFGLLDIDKLLKPDGPLTKGEATDINGVKAIGLVDGSADGDTLYVATTGEPYPLRLVDGKKPEGSQINFSDFGATFDLKAPSESQVVDLEELSRN